MPINFGNKYENVFREKGASRAQVSYIAILFDNCYFNTAQKRDYLGTRYNVKSSDELTTKQASLVIADLICRKDQNKLPLKGEGEE